MRTKRQKNLNKKKITSKNSFEVIFVMKKEEPELVHELHDPKLPPVKGTSSNAADTVPFYPAPMPAPELP